MGKTRAVGAKLKLKLDLVPKPLWGKNLRSPKYGLGPNRWKILRQRLKAAGKTRCAICESLDRLHGHEVWAYREQARPKQSVAKLVRVEMICRKCHDIHHWGNTIRLIAFGKITRAGYLGLRKHFRIVNQCTQMQFDQHIEKSLAVYKRRSAKRWRIDWGNFKGAVAEAKSARNTWASRRTASIERNEAFPSLIGHHMPNSCPKCLALGSLKFVESDSNEMSEGQEIDYESGVSGMAFCSSCRSYVYWEI